MHSVRLFHLPVLPVFKFYDGIIDIISGGIINGDTDIVKFRTRLACITVSFLIAGVSVPAMNCGCEGW